MEKEEWKALIKYIKFADIIYKKKEKKPHRV